MYKIVATKTFIKHLKKLDKNTQILIKNYIETNIKNTDNPRTKGKQLKHNLGKYWRYRVGNYRLICEINDNEVTIVLIDVGHRKDIY